MLIVAENGWPVNRLRTLIVPRYLIEEVTKTDGTTVVFDEPFLQTEKSTHFDGRQASYA